MKNLFAKLMANYLADEKGLVTIEWVGIAAVVVVAGILISAGIMGAADTAGQGVYDDLNGTSGVAATATSGFGSYSGE